METVITFEVETDREEDGRWLAEVIALSRPDWADFVFAFP
jgi:hypothetical protein